MSKHALGTVGGTLLVAGTSIGGGMLGLPVITGPAGFFPSVVVLVLCWAFMTATGILLAELCLWQQKEVNILSISKKTLGKPGRYIAWVTYLFLFYSLTVAYLVGGSNLLTDFFAQENSSLLRIVLFGAVFISIVAIGKRLVNPLNKALMFGLLASYFGFLLIGIFYVNHDLLLYKNWALAYTALPIAFTSFGFQGTVPTLSHWMHYDKHKIRKAIVIGTSLTLAVYILWEWLLIGIIPQGGEHGLLATLKEGRDAIHPLQYFTSNPVVWDLGRIFAFCAIGTSFLGVGIGLVDFLADGLSIQKSTVLGKAKLLLLAFGLPFFIAIFFPHIFLEALNVAGGFGCAILLGALPIAMVFWAKYKQKVPLLQDSFLGKKEVLVGLFAFVSIEVIIELVHIVQRL